jgi:6-phosphofructokinase 1
MGTIGVLTSGGDAPGMNAAVRAVVRVAAQKGLHVVGWLDGYDGLVDGRARELTRDTAAGPRPIDAVDDVLCRGGTFLGSARSTRFRTHEGRAAAARHLRGHDGLVVLGGDGSLAGAHRLAAEHGARIVGIPASIDNDIGCTAMALGVDTALNTIVQACDRIADTAGSHRRAFVVEVMGRRSGYLAVASAVACGADGVLVPEDGRTEESVLAALETLVREGFAPGRDKKRLLVIKAEGVEIPCTRLVRLVQTRIDAHMPHVELRAAVFGHLVRGGAPSYADRMIGARLGLAAVDALLGGATDEMCAWLPTVPGGTATRDPSVCRFPLARVVEESAALLDGSSVVTKWRLGLLKRVEGALAI